MHRNDIHVPTKLLNIANKARTDPKCRFTSLFHLMNKDLLLECFWQLRTDAASGIDNITKQEYADKLHANLDDLVERLHKMAYRPQPVLRVYIPKPGSQKMRPLGIPALEDKLVQRAMAKILGSIYEEDFIDDSYGFRPERGCHDALRALSLTVENERIHHIVEADIKGFFDNVDQDWMMKFLEHRIADKRMLRYIKRFLKAGVQEDGQYRASEKGTPQGGSISPLLANIYLHYVLDLWFEKKVKQECRGYARLIRYADDFVVCFEDEQDANNFRVAMEERLNQFNLEVAPEKTKVIEFGVLAPIKAKARGEKAQTFDFLGFTHYCSKCRKGRRFRMKRKTIGKRLTAKCKLYEQWLKANRILPTAELLRRTAMKLRGHYAYYGVTDNIRGLSSFTHLVEKVLFKWLNRRGKRGCYTWAKFRKLLEKYPLPKPRIMVNLLCP